MAQKILITGTSAGFGALVSKALLAEGHTVVASMRAPQGRNQKAAAELRAAGAHIVEIDVTDDQSVQDGVALAIELAGGLDVLINNAGVGVLGLQEAFTPEDFQHLFDINVFGVQRMNRAVIPFFRRKRQGLLLHVSSLLGRITIPFYGPYNASKWALEAVVENYRTELSAFGIEAALIEPGGFPTSFMDRLIRPSDTVRSEQYGEMAALPEQAQQGFDEQLRNTPEQSPHLVADAVLEVLQQPRGERAFRTTVDKIGMGDAVQGYNQQLQAITEGIYGKMGIDHLLKLNQG